MIDHRLLAFEAVLRTFPPAAPVGIRWTHPFFVIDEDLDPSRLKQAATGRKQAYDSVALAALLKERPLTSKEWQDAALERLEMPRKTFTDYRDRLLGRGLVRMSSTSDTYHLPE